MVQLLGSMRVVMVGIRWGIRGNVHNKASYRSVLQEGAHLKWQGGRTNKLGECEKQLDYWEVCGQGPCMLIKIL